MFTTRRSLISTVVAGAVLAPAATAQAAPTTLAVEQAPTRVAAWDATVMWSRLDPATKRYSLLKSVGGGAPTPVAVAPREAPFDIDLGTDRSGATVAVYTRDGDVHRLNVATGNEARVVGLRSATSIERDPTIHGGRIAFIRRSGGRDELRIAETSGARASRLLVRLRSIVSAELGDRHVAYVDSRPSQDVGGVLTVHIRNLRTGADRGVYRAVSGGANFANVTRPTFDAEPAGFVWARTNLGSGTGNRLVRYTLRGSQLRYAPGSSRYLTTAWAGSALGAATSSSLDGSETPGACTDGTPARNYCGVALSGPLRFDLKP